MSTIFNVGIINGDIDSSYTNADDARAALVDLAFEYGKMGYHTKWAEEDHGMRILIDVFDPAGAYWGQIGITTEKRNMTGVEAFEAFIDAVRLIAD